VFIFLRSKKKLQNPTGKVCHAFCFSSFFLMAAYSVFFATFLRCAPVSRKKPTGCRFFASLRVATGCANILKFFIKMKPVKMLACVVRSVALRFLHMLSAVRLRRTLLPPPLLHSQAARDACPSAANRFAHCIYRPAFFAQGCFSFNIHRNEIP